MVLWGSYPQWKNTFQHLALPSRSPVMVGLSTLVTSPRNSFKTGVLNTGYNHLTSLTLTSGQCRGSSLLRECFGTILHKMGAWTQTDFCMYFSSIETHQTGILDWAQPRSYLAGQYEISSRSSLATSALVRRHAKRDKDLAEHTKVMIPLKVGQVVLSIQNQAGNHPLRWDRLGHWWRFSNLNITESRWMELAVFLFETGNASMPSHHSPRFQLLILVHNKNYYTKYEQ